MASLSTPLLSSLITEDTKLKVSSTLDKSVGKKYLTDGSPDTCWTSQQGLPQYIQLSFPNPVSPKRVSLTFQGGFVGSRCEVTASGASTPSSSDWAVLDHIFPEDVNRPQVFNLKAPSGDLSTSGIRHLKLVFHESSDFFGRITIYDLRVEGESLA